MISVSDTGNSQTCRMIYQGQSLLPCLRRSKGLSTRLHRVSQSHHLARPLLQVQPPSPQRAPLRLRLLKSYVMCSLVTRSCCISLETRLVLNSDYMKQFSFLCVCYCCPCWCFLRVDWCLSRISCSVYMFIRWVMTSVLMWWTKNSLWMSSEHLIYFFLVALHH